MNFTKLQLESAKDLLYVFNNVEKKAKELLQSRKEGKINDARQEVLKTNFDPNKEDETINNLSESLARILSIVSKNCQVKGMEWDEYAKLQEEKKKSSMNFDYEPLDAELVNKHSGMIELVDIEIMELTKIKKDVYAAVEEELQPLRQRKLLILQETEMEEKLMDDNVLAINADGDTAAQKERLKNAMFNAESNINCLLQETPALISRLRRYKEFIEAEVGLEENFQVHLKRFSKSIADTPKERLWKKIEDSWKNATTIPPFLQ